MITQAQFDEAFDKSLATVLVPYLDNIMHNLDKIKENNSKTVEKTMIESVDDLF